MLCIGGNGYIAMLVLMTTAIRVANVMAVRVLYLSVPIVVGMVGVVVLVGLWRW